MNVVLFNRADGAQLPMTTRTSKGGATTVAYMNKKAYGEEKHLKGAALSRAHLQYRIDFGMVGNKSISAMLTGGEIVAQKVTTTKDGFKVAFTHAHVLGAAPAADPKQVAATVSTEELLAIIAARKPAPAQAPATV